MKFSERLVQSSLFVCALSSILIILLIILFIINEGLPAFSQVGVLNFITGSEWNVQYNVYGIFPMIVGTLIVTLLSLIIGVPLGVGCAIFLAEIAPLWARNTLKPTIETLAGIPSVVYGFFGLILIVPFIQNTFGGPGVSVLACGVVLAIMILPTIISVSEDSLRSVPREYREGRSPSARPRGRPSQASSSLRHAPAFWPALSWRWAAPSGKPWLCSWSAEAS